MLQVSSILPMLQRGIGIHHSGLLPIVKEVTEILFQEGLIKVNPPSFDQSIPFNCTFFTCFLRL